MDVFDAFAAIEHSCGMGPKLCILECLLDNCHAAVGVDRIYLQELFCVSALGWCSHYSILKCCFTMFRFWLSCYGCFSAHVFASL
eukprot:6484555-Amphidinium_carterae.1